MATTTVLGLTLTLTPPLLTTLRLLPLLSATASLTHAYCEWLTTTSFLHPPATSSRLTRSIVKPSSSNSTSTPQIPTNNTAALEAAKDILIPVWFVNFFHTGLYSVIGFNSLTTSSALANLFLFPDGLGGEGKMWYTAGLVAALAHYAFVPGVMGSVERLFTLCVRRARGGEVEEEETGAAARSVREWVGVHRVRWGTVDAWAWGCFLVGVVGVLTP
ncbi:hypothetical protein BU26DRAFT_544903 [Trematosphaeria pertusa]|uniref:DUF1772-domain-containing protein n=1 Tax=Trematosphaeria pertusa TaxID=390896 RepID=A0A6A6HSA7_9PLEO|nr:uncharacterized protein BU26DRAFT_544903 [Trematosphaeria pertusa]KAF2240668.1 hypothetical protein BU26DRAFT_544903 [Trematosphaeria pertusa]